MPVSLEAIEAVISRALERRAAKEPTWRVFVPPSPLVKYIKDDHSDAIYGAAMPLAEAINASRQRLAVGFDYSCSYRNGGAVALAGNRSLIISDYGDRSYFWDTFYFAWDTLPWWHREYVMTLVWAPIDPLTPIEVMSRVAE